MLWKHTCPISKKFTLWPPAGKLILTVFWDSQGTIPEHYLQVQYINGMSVV